MSDGLGEIRSFLNLPVPSKLTRALVFISLYQIPICSRQVPEDDTEETETSQVEDPEKCTGNLSHFRFPDFRSMFAAVQFVAMEDPYPNLSICQPSSL
jgi:hypothetical protein